MMPGRRRGIWFLAFVLTAGGCAAGATDRQAAAAPRAPAPMMAAASPEPPAPGEYEDLPFMSRTREEAQAEAPGVGRLFARTLGALIFIVGLIAAAAWGLRRIGGTNRGGPSEERPEMAVLGTISLGDRRSLSAVRFGERILLLGMTAQSVTLLATERRRPAWVPPPMRSVAELLEEDDPPAFDKALARAGERIDRRPRPQFIDQHAPAPGSDPELL